jgi:hypothetical protein
VTFLPRDYQIEDLDFLHDCPTAALFWEQGLGKTSEIVWHINRRNPDLVLVLTPAMCRSVWQAKDPSISDVALLSEPRANIYAYNQEQYNRLYNDGPLYVVASLESVALDRHYKGLKQLFKEFGKKPDIAICDESSFIRSPKAERTHSVISLMHMAKQRIILNGTPTGKDELDLWSQYEALDPGILGYRNYFHFRANHGIPTGKPEYKKFKATNVDTIYRRTAKYTRRRLKKDHLKSLPEKLSLPPREVALSTATWKLYTSMRDDMVAFMESPDARSSLASSGGVAVTRLAQITSGFLGGLHDDVGNVNGVQEVSCEKSEALVADLVDRDMNYPIIWCRFQPEMQRLVRMLASAGYEVHELHGKATEAQKTAAKITFRSRVEGGRKKALVAHPAAGSLGLTFVASNNSRYLSQDFNFINRSQSEDRSHRGGQDRVCDYQDYLAVGPNGQQTVDHKISRVLRERLDIAEFSSEQWIKLLKEE